jgi:hypothetical protein
LFDEDDEPQAARTRIPPTATALARRLRELTTFIRACLHWLGRWAVRTTHPADG